MEASEAPEAPGRESAITSTLHAMGLAVPDGEENVKTLLEENGLSLRDVIEGMGHIAQTTTSDPLRMRALENAAKIHGVMKPDAGAVNNNFKLVIYAPQVRSESDFVSVEI